LCETWTSHHDTPGRLVETFGLRRKEALWETEDIRTKTTWMVEKSRLGAFNDLSDDKVPNAVTVFEYKSDEIGNWVERHAFHRFRSASRWTEKNHEPETHVLSITIAVENRQFQQF